MSNTTTANDIALTVHDLLEPVLAAAGLELVDVVLHSATLQVLVESIGGRIDLEGVAAATRLVDETLEAADPVPGAYTLEVSSPGLERPLRKPEHFQRFISTTITVKTNPGVDGERRVEGVLVRADDQSITVDDRVIAYVDIERARTVFVWGGQPKGSKPGGPKGANGAKPVKAKKTANSTNTAQPSEGDSDEA